MRLTAAAIMCLLMVSTMAAATPAEPEYLVVPPPGTALPLGEDAEPVQILQRAWDERFEGNVPGPTEIPVIDFITPPRTSLIGDLGVEASGDGAVATVISLVTGDDPPAICAESDQQERYRATILMERGYGATHTFEYCIKDGKVESVDAEAVPDAPSPYVIYLGQDSIDKVGGVGEPYYVGQTTVDFCFGIRTLNRPVCLSKDTIIFDFEIDATTNTISHSTRTADETNL